MNTYYDRDGQPMDLKEWGERFGDENYKRIERATKGDEWQVSTVWLGIDHNFG